MNQVSFQDVYQTEVAPSFEIGQRASTPDGREWQYVKANAAISNTFAVVPVAFTAEDLWSSSQDNQGRNVYLSRAASSMTIGAFAQGIGIVDAGTGSGQTFKIQTNNGTTLTLYPETALATALAVADSDLTFGVMSLVTPAAVTSKVQMCQGGNQVAFSASDYGWILTNGDGRVMTGGALTVGGGFITGDDTAGQVIAATTNVGSLEQQTLGYAITAGATDAGALVRWITR